MLVDYDPFSEKWREDPYAKYRELRDFAPVHRTPESGVWVLSRYDDVQAAFKDAELFSSKIDNARRFRNREGVGGLLAGLKLAARTLLRLRVMPTTARDARFLIQTDGEIHRAMRKIVNRGFTPSRIAEWEPRIREIAEECMESVRGRDEVDLVQALAIPLPVRVIAELLGIEPSRREDFKRWSDHAIRVSTGPESERGDALPLVETLGEMMDYLRPIIRARRARPTGDLISTLVESQEGDDPLSDYEVFMFIFLLLLAGNETTTNLLGNAVDALYEHPEELAKVSNDLSLVPALVEETLRYDGPVQQLARRLTRDATIHGVTIPARSEVQLLLGSANRDERRFPDPDRLDLSRDPTGHLGFGFGAHFCLGAALARLEARVALEALVPELAGRVRSRPELEFVPSNVVRGRARLELRAA